MEQEGREKEGKGREREGGKKELSSLTLFFFLVYKRKTVFVAPLIINVTAKCQVLEVSLHLSTKLPQRSFVKTTHTKKQVGSRPSGLTSQRSPG